MSGEAARLWITVGADVRSAMANMRAIDRQVDQSAAVVKRTNPILQGLGQGLGLAAIGSAALATKAVADLAFASIDAASDLREAVTLSDQVFESNSARMQAWAADAEDAFGQSQREALNFASGFGTAFKNVGMDLDDVGTKSQSLTRLAADLGSAFNKSSEEAATALRSGLIGETEPMRRFGVFLSEAAVQSKALEMGIADAGEELSDTQKVAARYAIIMEQTADSQGMFGRDSESLADAQKMLGTSMENLSAKVGETLMPAMVDLVNYVREDGIPVFEDWAESLGSLAENTGKEVDFIAGKVQDARNLFELLTPWDDWIPGTEMFHDGMRNVSESIEYMATASKDDLASLTPPLDAIARASTSMATEVRRSNDDIVASFGAMRTRLTDVASGAADAIYGPLIAKGELAATEREISEQRQIVAAKNSTAEQVADAKLRMDELSASKLETLALLVSYGDQAAADALASSSAIQSALDSGTEEQKAAILALRRELALLRLDALAAAGALDFTGLAQGDRVSGPGYSGARAAGGPVRKDEVYLVGEEGPEPFIPWTNGTILPNDTLASGDRHELEVPAAAAGWAGSSGTMASSGGGGGSQDVNVRVTLEGSAIFDTYGDGAQRLADALLPGITRALARAGGTL